MLPCTNYFLWNHIYGWRGGATGRALDLRSTGRGFKSYARQSCVTTMGSSSHLCASVTKQYNLVSAKGRWCYVAGKVTAGLAESNSSLPAGGWLIATCGQTARTPESAPGLTSMGRLHLYPIFHMKRLQRQHALNSCNLPIANKLNAKLQHNHVT